MPSSWAGAGQSCGCDRQFPHRQRLPSWSEDEIDAFDARWPFGTRERLAKELLLATAQRRSDVLALAGNRQGNELVLITEERQRHDRAHGARPAGSIAHVSERRAGISKRSSEALHPTGFYNWFKRACVKAGIGHCSPGLRKATSRRLAEAGATVLEAR
jgi:hypothetical protein